MIMSIGFHTEDDFIACLVCGGSLFMAYRGLFRVVKGSIVNNNLKPVLLGDFHSATFSTGIPITQLDQFIIMSLPDLSDVLTDDELVEMVSTRNRVCNKCIYIYLLNTWCIIL